MTDQTTTGLSDRLTETATRYQAALERDPENPELLHCLGRVMGQLGQRDLELALVGQAIARAPENPGFHADFGLALLDAGHPADARAEFEAALGLEPGHADALGGLAELAIERGEVERAQALAGRCGSAGRRTARVRGRLAAMAAFRLSAFSDIGIFTSPGIWASRYSSDSRTSINPIDELVDSVFGRNFVFAA